MDAFELAKLLRQHNVTVRAIAAALAMHERTMFRYLSGEAVIPRTVEYAMRWWLSRIKPS